MYVWRPTVRPTQQNNYYNNSDIIFTYVYIYIHDLQFTYMHFINLSIYSYIYTTIKEYIVLFTEHIRLYCTYSLWTDILQIRSFAVHFYLFTCIFNFFLYYIVTNIVWLYILYKLCDDDDDCKTAFLFFVF